MKRGRTEMRRAATKMMRCLMPGHHCCPPRRHAATKVWVPFGAKAAVSLRPATNRGVPRRAIQHVSPATLSHAATIGVMPFGATRWMSLRARPIPVCHLVAQQRVPRPSFPATNDHLPFGASMPMLPARAAMIPVPVWAISVLPPALILATKAFVRAPRPDGAVARGAAMIVVPPRGPIGRAAPTLSGSQTLRARTRQCGRAAGPATIITLPFGAGNVLSPAPLAAAVMLVPFWATAALRQPRATTHTVPFGAIKHVSPAPFNHRRQG